MKIKSGGGANSTQVRHSTGYKTEPKPKAISPAAVNQMGVSTAFKKERLEVGRGYEPQKMAPTGSRGTYNAATSGPGSQRTTYKAGTQQASPVARDLPVGKKTF